MVRAFVEHFVTLIFFFFTERSLLVPRSTPKLEDHPLSTIRDCFHTFTATLHIWWAGAAQYSDWLLAGRSGDRIPVGRGFLQPCRPALRPTQPPVRWVPVLISGDKTDGAWR